MVDEIIYNDVYSVSVFDILKYRRPRNLELVKQMLDSNGYFGRYELIYKLKRGKRVEDFKLKIYLPYSRVYYFCPYKGYFDMEDYLYGYEKLTKKIPRGSSIVYYLAIENIIVDPIQVVLKSSLNHREAIKAIDFLHSIGILHDHQIKLKEEKDFDEICGNLLANK